MLAGALAFLGTPIGRSVGLVFAVLALLGGLYGLARHQGAESIRQADRKVAAVAKADLATHEAKATQISVEARNTLDQRQAQIITRYRTLTLKVPTYVTVKDDARCNIGSGFISVFNSAARGEADLPRPPGGSEGSPSGVPLSAVLSTTVEDFGVAYSWRAEALSWRDWYVAQKKAWETK